MRARFRDRVVVITGGGTGIGRAIAQAFAREGARVVVAGRNANRLREVTEAVAIPCDVTQREQVDNLFAQTIAQFGRIDILVNNAGTAILGPVEVTQFDDAVALFETNFY